jgi:capsular polysaccharide biosynthesis protein
LALEADPSLRVLLSSNRPPATVPGFQREIFKALGIPLERVEVIHPFDVVEVERLVAATPQFENPYYVDPELAAVWRRLVEGLLPRARAVSPAKIFVSRRPAGKRNCYEALEIEQFFARHGFHVFYPEDLSFADQASLFANARVVAGLGGSNMFTMLAAPQARILIIAGDGYNAENEHLIAAANGNELHYFWGRSDLQTAEGFSQLDAARSDFHFDLAQHQRDLEAVSA